MNLAGQFLKHFGVQKKEPDFRFLSEIMTPKWGQKISLPFKNNTGFMG